MMRSSPLLAVKPLQVLSHGQSRSSIAQLSRCLDIGRRRGRQFSRALQADKDLQMDIRAMLDPMANAAS